MDTTGIQWVVLVLGLNCLAAAGLFVFALLRTGGLRHTFFLYAWFTLVCPVVGPMMFLLSRLIGITFHKRRVSMAEISFSKIREKNVMRPDSETEMNYVPLEDAIAFADAKDLRKLMINILKSGDRAMLAGMTRAINNPDTEVSHYAATAVLDTLSDFRLSLLDYTRRLETNPDDVKTNLFIVEYTYQVLRMHVMDSEEQAETIHSLGELMETLYTHNLWYMKDEYYLWIVDLLISIGNFSAAEPWVTRAMQHQSEQLVTYKARLHLYYAKKDAVAFFSCMKELEHATLPVDKEILDLIRVYGTSPDTFLQTAKETGDAL